MDPVANQEGRGGVRQPAAQLFGAQSLDPGMVGAIAQEAVFCIGAIELPCTA
ncbi:MAG: Response regulators consisting of a CheY-like receiver domain and a winged-helix DNA-binding domain [uncultured Paraburkholderia sp.]|nr:MAG: Response regulators consisting of a CheY-like receiver domain and a winged-helix DNA-binding domain [uncultured Paraburkholderia sp.]CAH2943407.1 MAG: Response regulators consisting of a CheY-like receiver domain and a winged-helix DNA-binding domain [uncultured Paraburkholderia sp.]